VSREHPSEERLGQVTLAPSLEGDVVATVSFKASTPRAGVHAHHSVGIVPLRVVDIVVGIPLCLLALPVVVVLALVLVVVHGTTPFFVHERVGWRGRRLMVPKLRTLVPGHDPYADKTAVVIVPRSRLTAFLRATHLDELPQLFLVPVGRMSLVGPRPLMAAEAAACRDREFDELRTTVLPGCTGLWQVSAAGGKVTDHLEYDRLYLEQRTVRLDLWILWRTAVQLLGAAPITLDAVPRWAMRAPGSVATAR
jgi:lipopolysaccharide/colanic/teichoic acid biosynthesis glycosyltransferase